MEQDESTRALDSFVAKWIAVEPELGIAINFLPPTKRASHAAFACLSRELAHTCFAIREGDVAVAKLGWWNEELLRAQQGEPRHPLTQTLAACVDYSEVDSSLLHDVFSAALQQRERDPAADFASYLAGFEQFFMALARVQAALFGNQDVVEVARAAALSHALRELAGVSRVLESGHLALPLDALARHRLRRDQLVVDGPDRRLAAAEHLQAITHSFDAMTSSETSLSLIHRASLIADRMRARKASLAADPVAELARQLPKLSMLTTWKIWRAARSG